MIPVTNTNLFRNAGFLIKNFLVWTCIVRHSFQSMNVRAFSQLRCLLLNIWYYFPTVNTHFSQQYKKCMDFLNSFISIFYLLFLQPEKEVKRNYLVIMVTRISVRDYWHLGLGDNYNYWILAARKLNYKAHTVWPEVSSW